MPHKELLLRSSIFIWKMAIKMQINCEFAKKKPSLPKVLQTPLTRGQSFHCAFSHLLHFQVSSHFICPTYAAPPALYITVHFTPPTPCYPQSFPPLLLLPRAGGHLRKMPLSPGTFPLRTLFLPTVEKFLYINYAACFFGRVRGEKREKIARRGGQRGSEALDCALAKSKKIACGPFAEKSPLFSFLRLCARAPVARSIRRRRRVTLIFLEGVLPVDGPRCSLGIFVSARNARPARPDFGFDLSR